MAQSRSTLSDGTLDESTRILMYEAEGEGRLPLPRDTAMLSRRFRELVAEAASDVERVTPS